MSRTPRFEGAELAPILDRLVEVLATIRNSTTTSVDHGGDLVLWADDGHIYVELTLGEGAEDHLDLCIHAGRLFLVAAR